MSNGAASVAEGLLSRAGVRDAFEQVLSVEDVGAWKPDPRVYRHALEVCGVPPADALMVAVHPWDLHGAHQVGMRTAYIDRTGAPWPEVFDRPEITVSAISELAAAL